jgi:hypothetical protein
MTDRPDVTQRREDISPSAGQTASQHDERCTFVAYPSRRKICHSSPDSGSSSLLRRVGNR